MVHALRKGLRVQVGQESAWGTDVSATAIMAGLNTVRYGPDDSVVERDELNGILTKTTGAPDVLGTAGKVYTAGYLSFQDAVYLLEAAYGTVSPGTGDGGSPAAFTRAYDQARTTEPTSQSMTLEAGGLTEAFQFPGAVLTSWEFTAGIKGYTMFTANWIAKDMINQAFTGALTRRSVTRVLSQLWEAFIDTSSAGLGGTAFTSCLTEIKFSSGPLWVYDNCIDGETTPTGIIWSNDAQPTVTLTMKQSDETEALFATYRAGSTRFIRLKNTGAVAIHDSVFPSLQIDLAGNLINYPEVGDAVADQQTTIPFVFAGTYDETWAAIMKATLVNSLSGVP